MQLKKIKKCEFELRGNWIFSRSTHQKSSWQSFECGLRGCITKDFEEMETPLAKQNWLQPLFQILNSSKAFLFRA